jgi:8-oxo-dGTP pyrophosphatase MutT (NUDIX family)
LRQSEIAPLRSAVTTIILRDNPLEVLLVKRHPAAFLGSMLTFPGGALEPDDASIDWMPHVNCLDALSAEERTRRIAACRETYEETGLVLTILGHQTAVRHSTLFSNLFAQQGIRLELDALHPFAHWVTPPSVARRFDTSITVADLGGL